MSDYICEPISQNKIHRKTDNFLNLPILQNPTKKRNLQVGIITQEIMGPSHGGVGTAYHAMAEALRMEGNSVTIFFVPPTNPSPDQFKKWKIFYENLGIQLELFPEKEKKNVVSLWSNATKSFLIMNWLKQYPSLDIIHFAIDHGLGYYTILAKHQGLAFQNKFIVLGAHSSTLWDAAFSYGDKTYYQDFLERNFLERECVRLTDFIVSPSRYFLEFLQNSLGWTLPQNSYIQPNIMSSKITPRSREGLIKKQKIAVKEFVFFGRLEKRKGIVLLCDALDHPKLCNRIDFSVSFMGHNTYIDGISSKEYIKIRSKKWKFPWKIIPRKDRDKAIEYLQTLGKVALIPSLSETMSYTVLECLWAGIPFLASKVGGIPELISSTELERCTFDLSPTDLAEKLILALEEGVQESSPSFNMTQNEKQWADWHQHLGLILHDKGTIKTGELRSNLATPKVSICIVLDLVKIGSIHQINPQISRKEYSNIELVIVLAGYDQTYKTPDLTIFMNEMNKMNVKKILFQKSSDHFEGLNLASMHASGEYFFFLNPGISLIPGAIEQFVSVAQKTGAGIITAAHKVTRDSSLDGSKEYVHFYLGSCLSLGLLHNVFGEKGFLIKESIWKKLEGFQKQDYGKNSFNDFLIRAILKGYHLETIPLPLMLEKESDQPINSSQKFLFPHPFSNNLPPEFQDLFYFIQATRFFHDPAPDGTFTSGFINRPQGFSDELWSSKGWKVYLSIANRARKFLGLPEYEYPYVTTLTEALRAVDTIHQSLFWNLLAPFIRLRRWLRSKID